MILALVSKKGGVGKSTTAVNLAAAFARAGQPTLLVDLDPQASASLSLGLTRSQLTPSAADVLLSRLPIDRAVRPTQIEGLSLLPGSTDLAGADHRLGQLRTCDQQLKGRLDRARDLYRYIVIDCPPSLSVLPTNAIVAADAFIVPTTPHFLAREGVENLLGAAERLAHRNQVETQCLGVLLTMVDRRARLMRDSVDELRSRLPRVFQTEIRSSLKLAEAPAFGQTIFEYAGSCGAAADYQRLCNEVLSDPVPFRRRPEGFSAAAPRPAARRSWVPGFQPAALENVG